jgi:hypothetical protein
MKKTLAGLAIIGAPLSLSAWAAIMPNVAFVLTIFFGGPFIAQLGIGLGVFITGLVLGININQSLLLGL